MTTNKADLDALAGQLGELARSLQGREDTDSLLQDVVSAAVALIPGVDEGSISMVVDRERIISRNPSGELPRIVDALQAETGEGPCLDAVFTEQTVRVPDMAHETRWPRFATRAAAAGAASMLSFQLFVQGDNWVPSTSTPAGRSRSTRSPCTSGCCSRPMLPSRSSARCSARTSSGAWPPAT